MRYLGRRHISLVVTNSTLVCQEAAPEMGAEGLGFRVLLTYRMQQRSGPHGR